MNLQNLLRAKMQSGLLAYLHKRNLSPHLIQRIEALQPTDALSLEHTGLLTARGIAVVLSPTDPEFSKLWTLWEMTTCSLSTPRNYAIYVLDKLTTLRCDGQRILRYFLTDGKEPRIGLVDTQGTLTRNLTVYDAAAFRQDFLGHLFLEPLLENIVRLSHGGLSYIHTYSPRAVYPDMRVRYEERMMYQAAYKLYREKMQDEFFVFIIENLLADYIKDTLA